MKSLFYSSPVSLLTTSAAALAGLTLGCVLTVGGDASSDCGDLLSHSHEVTNSTTGETECKCDLGYEWEDEADPDNFECDPIPPRACPGGGQNSRVQGDNCVCDLGYNWCSDDPDDFNCCDDDQQAPTGGAEPTGGGTGTDDSNDTVADTGTGDGVDDTTAGGPACEATPAEWNGNEPVAEDCNAETLGFAACSNGVDDGPTGSRYWECEEGGWVESDSGTIICMMDGFDFAYGCVDDGTDITWECGVGDGADCSGPECDECLDGDVIQSCDFNKASQDSCLRICMEDGDADGVTYDFGSCEVGDDGPACACCDEGDKGCKIPA